MKKLIFSISLSFLMSGVLFAAPSKSTPHVYSLESKWIRDCDAGDAASCTALGEEYASGNEEDKINKNLAKAVLFLSKGCDGGIAEGCFNLGIIYENGQGVKQDYFKAVELYGKACDGGEAKGCFNLGAMYVNGQGVRQSRTDALKYFGKACDLKYQNGCTEYAKLNTSK